jgi:hypothetical protein
VHFLTASGRLAETGAQRSWVTLTRCLTRLQGNVTVERAALAVHLVHEARRLYPAIQFHFGTAIQVRFLFTACERGCDECQQMYGMTKGIRL